MDALSDQHEQCAHAESPELVIDMADVASLTLGQGGQGSESKRYEYN